MNIDFYERIWMWAAGAIVAVFIAVIGMSTVAYGLHPPSHVETIDLACAASCAPIAAPVRLDAIVARADDAAVRLERGGWIVARGGRLVVVDGARAKATALGEALPATTALFAMPTGVAAWIVAGDDVVRTLR